MHYLFFILTFCTLNLAAQDDEAAIKGAVNSLFEYMRKGDTTMLRKAFAPTAVLQTIAKNGEGKITVRTDAINDFIISIGQPHTEVYDERINFGTILIDADLASVWTPYKFYVGEKLSHCGVNSFQLVRINSKWKIQYIIDTRRREGCE